VTPALNAKFFRARATTLRAQADATPWESAEFGVRETEHAKALQAEAAIFEEAAAQLEAEDGQLSEGLKLTTRKLDAAVQRGALVSGLEECQRWAEVPCRFSGNGREGCFVAEVNRHGGPCVPCWARALLRIRELKGKKP
jgi:hypothetical protein